MNPIKSILALSFALSAVPALADQISADRPGIGSDPEVIPQFTLQGELGTDSKEVRLGVLPGFELDRDQSSWGAKIALADTAKLKVSFRASYDNELHTVLEIPANYTVNALFNLGTTVVWSRTMQTYAGEFNFTPTKRLTITPTLYYESKLRTAIFAAWVLPGHDNWQLDIGYDQHRVSAGISTALDLARLFRKQ